MKGGQETESDDCGEYRLITYDHAEVLKEEQRQLWS